MEVVERSGYSPLTIRDALDQLINEGLVEKYGRYYAIAQLQD